MALNSETDEPPKGDRDSYHTLLVEYATGALDEACSLIVATHLALSPSARKVVQDYESVGGAVLKKCCQPVAMKTSSLEKIMARVEEEEKKTAKCDEAKAAAKGGCSDYNSLPACLKNYLGKSCNGLPWKVEHEGFKHLRVKTCCSASKASLWKLAPGIKVNAYTPAGHELKLVLTGVYHDENGAHSRGELFILDQPTPHSASADPEQGCLVLVVRRKPKREGGFLRRLLGGFCK